ncbi:hypothetical protein ABIC99_003639 [Sphaerotilus sulfidivorans]|uniref:DUF3322 and DUF2220 domain-containing protein n=1 Tax=Sphaerotilus sulfidivorans TaxID=639200 RepID=A0A5C1PXK5_9BURK|nr:Wadjet anti-phage system protein JetD domain-containing protein [Sphaerotilus sulfidivorans]NZD47751.1 hypothetical protein [Sphaerotilus sulfidivorans]QEM99335.1 hypothetical protein EWH46_00200 [Sphaerotilus sulfidivorans]
MAKKLQTPEQVKNGLTVRYQNQHRAWLGGAGTWPLEINLGTPTEADFAADISAVRRWVDAWSSWRGVGELHQERRQFMRIGVQTLPSRVILRGPEEVAAWCGQAQRWQRAALRCADLVSHWPRLQERHGLGRHFDVLADYSESDYTRLHTALAWLLSNPASGLHVRQLPLEGIDTKWLEQRKRLIVDLLGLIRNSETETDFHTACGLVRAPHRVRMRILCPIMRKQVGGLRDIEAPVSELAALSLNPQVVLLVENQETGLALQDMPGVVSFMRLGAAVSVLGSIPWLAGRPAVYWGDIDTHGLAILARARRVLPSTRSVMMDAATLERYIELTVQEPTQHADAELPELTLEEINVFKGLRSGRWGERIRLEQERITWPDAMRELQIVLEQARRHATAAP